MHDDSWTADWITGATQFGGVEQEAGRTALYQQGLLIPGLGAAVFLSQADLAGPTVQIPCLSSVKVHKEHWFKFDAGSDTSATHTWEWDQHIDFTQLTNGGQSPWTL